MSDEQTLTDNDCKDFTLEDARAIFKAQLATQDLISEGIQTLQSLMEDCQRLQGKIDELAALRRAMPNPNPGPFSPYYIAAAFLGGVAGAFFSAFLTRLL